MAIVDVCYFIESKKNIGLMHEIISYMRRNQTK